MIPDMTHAPSPEERRQRPYQEQLARAGRLYAPVLQRTVPFTGRDAELANVEDRVVHYEDGVWSFFIHCWHVRDWLKYDTTVDAAARNRALQAAEASLWLQVCADLANGRKHFELQRPRVGAGASSVRASMTLGASGPTDWTLEAYVQVDETGREPVAAAEVAWEALRAWKQILEAEHLPLPPGFPDLTTRPTVSVPMCR